MIVKLLYSDSFNDTVGVGMQFCDQSASLTKQASTIFGCDYDDIKPDKNHVGIHVVALGDAEHYGANRNADLFPKKACAEYHDTFVKYGHVFRHHKNKDPEKSLGTIVKSAYNEPMGRVELFIHVDKEKAPDELQKLAEDGTISFSMSCKVKYDRCTICGGLRKFASDPDQCSHVLTKLGTLQDDGKYVGTYNDHPKWFDISFVTRPADRIAWDLKVAADFVDSVKLAEDAGIHVPDAVAIDTPEAEARYALMQKLAACEAGMHRSVTTLSRTSTERYQWELCKAAGVKYDDALLSVLRNYSPERVFYGLAKRGAVLDVESFYKYAMGGAYDEVEPYMPALKQVTPYLFSYLLKSGAQSVCNNRKYDVNTGMVDTIHHIDKVASQVSFQECYANDRIITMTLHGKNPDIHLDTFAKIGSNVDDTVTALAEQYAAYKLAAAEAIVSVNKDTNEYALTNMLVAQNFITN